MKQNAILTVLSILAAFIVSTSVFGHNSNESDHSNLNEGPNTTYVEKHKGDKAIYQHGLDKNRELKDQIKESSVIVKGEVVKILGVVETKDLLDAGQQEMVNDGVKFIHTNVVIKVDQYLGKTKLPFDEIVVRHPGGRIDEYVNITSHEELTVGEKVILFRLDQPENMTQVPEGYEKEQYFLFNMHSKYVSNDNKIFTSGFKKNEYFDADEIKKEIEVIHGE